MVQLADYVHQVAGNVNHWRWWVNSVPSAETTTKSKIENMNSKLRTSSHTIANENVGGSTGTRMWECVDCGWFGTHEARAERQDESWTTYICPHCQCESFYASETKVKPCDICGDDVLVQERVDKPLDGTICGKCHTSMLDDEEDDFDPCSDCDGHDACADFGCAIKAGIILNRQDW